jgi:hypothetical protein
LSFNAQSTDVLNALRPQSLPQSELVKLDGAATIVDDALQISVHNGTSWDVREITVGLTVIRRPSSPALAFYAGSVKLVPAVTTNAPDEDKRSDVTVLYHLKGSAAPSSATVFRETLGMPLEYDEEWHWAILQAKGIPPSAVPPSAEGGQ